MIPDSPSKRKAVLVTGGTGYIGSFTTLALLESGYPVIIVDNLSNSTDSVVSRINILRPPTPDCPAPTFHKCDVTDGAALDAVFAKHEGNIDSVIHFAALKSVGESTEIPLEYYRVNVGGTMTLLQTMQKWGVKKIVFSSSATVYGDATRFENMIPIPEVCPLGPTNPYGNTKMMIERVIQDQVEANPGWCGASLRYFNPAGAHPSGIMGEDPCGVPYNLLPLLSQVAVGLREKLHVFGIDYASHDGTAIRDYIHILDLASGHLAALAHLEKNPDIEFRAWNLGTGRGSTVFDIIKAFSKVVGRDLPYEIHPRRLGDVLDLTAKPERARVELGWKSEKTLDDACTDLWRWVKGNPKGFKGETTDPSLMEEAERRAKLGGWKASEGK